MDEGNSDGVVAVDLFVSKTKKPQRRIIITTDLKFTDSFSNLVFSVDRPPRISDHRLFKRLLSDSSGNPLIFISHNHQKASWEGFSSSEGNNDAMFRVERTTKTLTRVEFEVFVNKSGNETADFKMRGSPFYRSCTIYKGDSIVAQTSLMYKLGIQNILVPRNRFRLTIFPGYADHAFIVALTIIFFYGRKLWI